MSQASKSKNAWIIPGLIITVILLILIKTVWGRLVYNPSESTKKISYLYGSSVEYRPVVEHEGTDSKVDLDKVIESQKHLDLSEMQKHIEAQHQGKISQ